jgi:hypothetical protein
MQLKLGFSSLNVATLLRSVCLSVTIISIVTGYLWIYQQDVVNQFDKRASQRYSGKYQSQIVKVE